MNLFFKRCFASVVYFKPSNVVFSIFFNKITLHVQTVYTVAKYLSILVIFILNIYIYKSLYKS